MCFYPRRHIVYINNNYTCVRLHPTMRMRKLTRSTSTILTRVSNRRWPKCLVHIHVTHEILTFADYWLQNERLLHAKGGKSKKICIKGQNYFP